MARLIRMTKTYYFKGGIDSESVQKFIEFANNNEKFILYLSSCGGDVDASEIMLEIINRQCTELIAMFTIHSCAFKLFFEAKCKKRIGKYCVGMYHLTAQELEMHSNGKFQGLDRLHCDNFKHYHKESLDFCENIKMTKEEINKIKQGKDCNFSYNRLKELNND